MGKTLYLECCSGISGDMTVAALLDLGADEMVLREGLSSLAVDGYQIRISRVKKAGIDMCDFDVLLDAAHENHDHDMAYLHGIGEPEHGHEHGENAGHSHTHGEAMSHSHAHEEERDHVHGENMAHSHAHVHAHEHRGMKEILPLIQNSGITDRAKDIAVRIFDVIAHAEAKAHGTTMDQVHFHEVGAVDSIVDIVAAAICLDNLDITDVVVEELYEGRGSIRCQHGILPVPVPAVANIAQQHGLRLRITNIQGELVTPTGAAIAAAIRTADHLPGSFTVEKIGLGAGKRKYEAPGFLRAMLIRPDDYQTDTICRLESNIDDCTGEVLGYVMERLMQEGAKDVSYTPVYMKKNRPAYQLNVICSPKDVHHMETIIFQETTTIGIRRVNMERTVLSRRIESRRTSLGEVYVKFCGLPEGERVYPEYEDVARICRIHKKPFYEVYQKIMAELNELVEK
ncbi:MAG: nickel pincer cofactor biosynthesis protein LarC [Blautia sp.]